MFQRKEQFTPYPLNIVGSSVFGRYPKISIERTYNMFESDGFMVPYAGYVSMKDSNENQIAFNGKGRAIFTSVALGIMIAVFGSSVYSLDIIYNPLNPNQYTFTPDNVVGTLLRTTGHISIAENNAGQILISDEANLYVYQKTASKPFKIGGPSSAHLDFNIDFVPGYVTFHDTYFICTVNGGSTWRLSDPNDGTTWGSAAANIGAIQTKPTNAQAVTRFPSRGNMIFVFGSNVTEPWFDVGYQLFPYQRNTAFNIDYGCISPATVAATDELVVWLAANEKSGPIIMASKGDMPVKISTDGLDYLFSQFLNPADSSAFIYRQDGHLFYHINFYTDNVSLFYDFNTQKFYHASDENLNYFIAGQVAFFNNQYYFVSPNTNLLYAFDTIYSTYDGNIIPRIRTCANVRFPDQNYRILNDVGFTIESGTTDYQYVTKIVNGSPVTVPVTPRVDLSVSYDGGNVFSSEESFTLPEIGNYRSKLQWWGLGMSNDAVCQFKFWGIGRFVATNGILNVRE